LSVCSLARYKIACELIKFSTGNLPRSALTSIFEEVFFVPRRCLQKTDSVQINKVASCKNLKNVKYLKLYIKNEITEKYKNLYKSKIDKILLAN
jgi:hypothetical protein